MNLSRNPFAALEIAFWLLGSIEDRSFRHVLLALPFIVAGAAILLSQRHAFRALSLGEETAQSLGVDVGARAAGGDHRRRARRRRRGGRQSAASASSAWSRRI